ncbi:MAG: iron-containing alcohol dehydrogenase, partial [Clostridiales bacterium]|nr:iron-containing alcohol dehydrogenase [Clostridiales bacterium]
MQDFTFFAPTEIVFGRGAQAKTAGLLKKHGADRVFVVYGGGSAVRSGLLAQITGQLEGEGLAYETYGGVQPNPLLSHAREGIKAAIGFGADFVLAVGGGSVIDEAKAIAHGCKNPQTDVWKFWERTEKLTASLPVGVVLTIAAAGSETSESAVLTDGESGKKLGFSSEFNRPRFAVMNPELAAALPKFQIACGVVDIIMHTLDRFFSKTGGNRTTDEIAASIMRVVIEKGAAAVNDPADYDAMSEIMWCGSLSHNGLTGLGRPTDFSVHQLGHELGGRFNVSHGASLSAMWGSWAGYCWRTDAARFAQYARSVWGVEEPETEKAALAGIDKTVEFFASIGMPVSLPQLGIGVLPDGVI